MRSSALNFKNTWIQLQDDKPHLPTQRQGLQRMAATLSRQQCTIYAN
jgi:hypothetical protein